MRHPPLTIGPAMAYHTHDLMTLAGARLLANKITEAWRRVGIQVEPVIERDVSTRAEPIFVVRLPGLVSGLPA